MAYKQTSAARIEFNDQLHQHQLPSEWYSKQSAPSDNMLRWLHVIRVKEHCPVTRAADVDQDCVWIVTKQPGVKTWCFVESLITAKEWSIVAWLIGQTPTTINTLARTTSHPELLTRNMHGNKTQCRPETRLTLLFLRATRTSSHRNLEPKRAENLRLRFASSAHLLQQTEQKAKIMTEKWRHWVNICNKKVVLSEYNNVSIINMLKTSNNEVIRVCSASCY